jgi:FKBP-type peptidyl-prolyl cis-trans isomerase
MHTSVFKSVLALTALLFVLSSCDTTDPFSIPPPDFSTVPEAFDITGIQPIEIENGIEAYILEEGTGQTTLTVRDQVSLFMTLRTTDGEIIYSTFNDGRTDPVTITVGNVQMNPNVFNYSVSLSYTSGLRKGLVGMQEGESRTLIVSPDQGFGNLSEGALNYQYRNSTLQYDIKVQRIAN